MKRHLDRSARDFAARFRTALVERACTRAVRRLGRALTHDELRLVWIAVGTFMPNRKRKAVVQ